MYLVNTDASQSVNTFYDLKLGKEVDPAEDVRDRLNGGDNNIDTDNSQYHVLKTYDAGIHVDGGDLYLVLLHEGGVRSNQLGLVIQLGCTINGILDGHDLAADGVVAQRLHYYGVVGAHGNLVDTQAGHVIVVGHEADVFAQILTKGEGGRKNELKRELVEAVMVWGYKPDGVVTLAVPMLVDIAGAKGVVAGRLVLHGLLGSFHIIAKGEGGRKNELKRELVEAVMVWGYNTGSNDTLYFYRQNSYDIEHKDNASSRAGEKLGMMPPTSSILVYRLST